MGVEGSGGGGGRVWRWRNVEVEAEVCGGGGVWDVCVKCVRTYIAVHTVAC